MSSQTLPHLKLDKNFIAVHCKSAEFSMFSIPAYKRVLLQEKYVSLRVSFSEAKP